MAPDFFTVPSAAKELGKPEMTLYRWIKSGKLIAITVGGILFVPPSEIERLRALLSQKDGPDAPSD